MFLFLTSSIAEMGRTCSGTALSGSMLVLVWLFEKAPSPYHDPLTCIVLTGFESAASLGDVGLATLSTMLNAFLPLPSMQALLGSAVLQLCESSADRCDVTGVEPWVSSSFPKANSSGGNP